MSESTASTAFAARVAICHPKDQHAKLLGNVQRRPSQCIVCGSIVRTHTHTVQLFESRDVLHLLRLSREFPATRQNPTEPGGLNCSE
eukprot:6643864-Alexandrium_andersonii.AAC.1